MMRATNVLHLSLLLCLLLSANALPDELMLYEQKGGSTFYAECDPAVEYECIPVKEGTGPHTYYKKYEGTFGNVRKKITLKNPKIVLEFAVIKLGEYVPDDQRRKGVLKKEMNDSFLNDINKMVLISHGDMKSCYEINIYDNGDTIAMFATDGMYFYEKNSKLLYISESMHILREYWGILTENACR